MATTDPSRPIARLEIDFNGNQAQAAFVRDGNEETAYIGGVGSGKTVAGLMRLARHIFEWNPGEQLAVVAPTVPMLRNVIVPEMQRWGLLGQPGIEYRRSENLIEYPNGTTVILESANNDRKIERLRGLNLAGAWLDEVAEHQHKTYQILGDRLRTGSYRNLWATGTPKGLNWVHDEFVEIEVLDREPVADGTLIRGEHTTTIHGVSTAANEANPDDYVRSRERQHAGQSYQQEVQGEFVRFEGLIYDWFDEAEHTTDELPNPGELEDVIYGVDWGYHNPALLVIGRHDGEWIVLEDYLGNETTVSDHLDRAKGMQERWLPGPFYCDPAEPSNIEQFKRAGLAARSAENDVLPGIQHVTALRDELTVHESCQYLVNELRQYRWKEDGDEMTDTPVKENDHLCDALRYALFTHDQSAPPIDDLGW